MIWIFIVLIEFECNDRKLRLLKQLSFSGDKLHFCYDVILFKSSLQPADFIQACYGHISQSCFIWKCVRLQMWMSFHIDSIFYLQ